MLLVCNGNHLHIAIKLENNGTFPQVWLDLAMGMSEKVVIFSYTYRHDLITVFASLNTISHFRRNLLANR